MLQLPGPTDPASESEHRQLPAAPGVGRAPVAGGLQGQRGQGPSVPTPAARPPRPLPLPTCGSLRRPGPKGRGRRPPERASRAHSTDPLGPPPLARVSGPPGPDPVPQPPPPLPRSASGPARSVCFCFVLPSNTGATAWRLLAERRTSRSQSWRPSCSRGGEAELGEVRRGNRGGAQGGGAPSAHARWAWDPLGHQPEWGLSAEGRVVKAGGGLCRAGGWRLGCGWWTRPASPLYRASQLNSRAVVDFLRSPPFLGVWENLQPLLNFCPLVLALAWLLPCVHVLRKFLAGKA